MIAGANLNVKNIPMRQVITSFAGLRAHEDGHESVSYTHLEISTLSEKHSGNIQLINNSDTMDF